MKWNSVVHLIEVSLVVSVVMAWIEYNGTLYATDEGRPRELKNGLSSTMRIHGYLSISNNLSKEIGYTHKESM